MNFVEPSGSELVWRLGSGGVFNIIFSLLVITFWYRDDPRLIPDNMEGKGMKISLSLYPGWLN